MKILFLHGWNSVPGGVKPTYLVQHGHEVINPALDDDDFDAALRTAQAEFDKHKPEVVVGSSRGGAVAMNINIGEAKLVLLCPAWKKFGTSKAVKPGTKILHSRADDLVPFADSEELVRNSGLPESALIEVGSDHRLADSEPLAAMLKECDVGLVATTTFAFLDTNIFIRYCTQATPGFDQESWTNVATRIQEQSVVLLLPEVVSLEFDKFVHSVEGNVANEIGKIDEAIKEFVKGDKSKIWNELGDITSAISKHNETWTKHRIEEIRNRAKEVRTLFTLPVVKQLDLTSDILLQVRKRRLSGQFPYKADAKDQSHNQGDADLWIIEALGGHFKQRRDMGITDTSQLLFCTENAKDFCVYEGESKTNALHPTLKGGLPPTKVFTNLKSLVDFIDAHKPVVEPPSEKVEEAAERERREQAHREEQRIQAGMPFSMPFPMPFSGPYVSPNELRGSRQYLYSTYAYTPPPGPDDYEPEEPPEEPDQDYDGPEEPPEEPDPDYDGPEEPPDEPDQDYDGPEEPPDEPDPDYDGPEEPPDEPDPDYELPSR